MKRTAYMLIINNEDPETWKLGEKITCEVTGEMADGAKVWTDLETEEQYFLTRICGRYFFYHI